MVDVLPKEERHHRSSTTRIIDAGYGAQISIVHTSTHGPLGITLMGAIIAALLMTSQILYGALLGDSIGRGAVLPTCTASNTPCAHDFLDDAFATRRFAGFPQNNFGTDGSDGSGILRTQIVPYCNIRVPLDFTIIHTGGNEAKQMYEGTSPFTLTQEQANFQMVINRVRACHPETKLIVILTRDFGYTCTGRINQGVSPYIAAVDNYERSITRNTPNARYMETFVKPGPRWYGANYYGPNMHGVVDGVQTGGNCEHPGAVGHRIYARSLVALMWPL